MPSTYHIDSSMAGTASFVLYSTPFLPKITQISASEVKVVFNAAYIYEYANSGKKIAVTGLTHTHGIDEEKEYQLKIKLDHKEGKIEEAKIIVKDSESTSNQIDNFYVDNEVPIELNSENPKDPADFFLDLAEIQGTDIKELYLRENIHWYYRGFKQLHKPESEGGSTGSDTNCVSILNTDESYNAFGMIGVKALVAPDPDNNDLSISSDGENIYLTVSSST